MLNNSAYLIISLLSQIAMNIIIIIIIIIQKSVVS
jgi:hypothetical protein